MKMLLLNLGLLFAISAEAQFPLFYKVLPTPVYSTHQSDFGLHIIVSGHQLIVSDLFGNEFGQRSVNLMALARISGLPIQAFAMTTMEIYSLPVDRQLPWMINRQRF